MGDQLSDASLNGLTTGSAAADARLRRELAGRSVLLLEDEALHAFPLMAALQQFGVEQIQHVLRGDVAQRVGSTTRFDILLMDRINADRDGVEALSAIRASGGGSAKSPAIIISSLGEPLDRIKGLLSGADDYMVKPLDPMELIARVVACLRRSSTSPQADLKIIRNCPLVINAHDLTVTCSGTPVRLSGQAFDLLFELAKLEGLPIAKTALFERCWPHWKTLPSGWENILAKAIERLRKAFEPIEQQVPEALTPLILSRRNLGYALRNLAAPG